MKALLGGVGGFSPIKKLQGTVALEIIAKTKICDLVNVPVSSYLREPTECLVLPTNGDSNWPTAEPMGFAIERSIVAVVRPFRLNHNSLYFGARTWYIPCAMAPTNYNRFN